MYYEFLTSVSGAALSLPVSEVHSKGGAVERLRFDFHNASTATLRLRTSQRAFRPPLRASAQRGVSFLFVRIFIFGFLFAACAPTATPTPEPQIINVYATPAAQPWLADAFECAPPDVAIRVADTPEEADISLRLGEPDLLLTPSYQIDTEEILVVTHRQSPLQNMAVEEVRELFAGQGDPSVQVWVYAQGEDVQGVFEQAVMQGRSVTSLARLAVSPQHMSDTLNSEPNAVGILPRRWKVGDSRFIYSIPDVPVLALMDDEPEGAVRAVIACLQE